MKPLNNLLAATIGAASVEALVAATKAGLTLDTTTSVLRTTLAWNGQLTISMRSPAGVTVRLTRPA